jgi:hypothetical protein
VAGITRGKSKICNFNGLRDSIEPKKARMREIEGTKKPVRDSRTGFVKRNGRISQAFILIPFSS